MPIYEYQCGKCGQVTEKMLKFSDPPMAVCPACGGGLKKLISDCSFHLKGSGWYVTDYAGKDAQTAQNKDKSGAAETKKDEKDAGKEKSKETKAADSKED